jgi:hypothetical protein
MGIVNISTAIHACYWFYPLMKAIDNEGIEQVSKIKNQYNCPNLYEDKNCYIEEQAFFCTNQNSHLDFLRYSVHCCGSFQHLEPLLLMKVVLRT